MSIPKEKRTKEQMMRLLDRAIEQEEILVEQVKSLEAELAECRKTAENPRHEVDERALPGSKVSFRLDFYRLEKKGPFKGIIEHLPSRETQTFEGVGMEGIPDFIKKYVGLAAIREQDVPVEKTVHVPDASSDGIEKKERSPLLRKLLPDFFTGANPGQPLKPGITPGIPAVQAVAIEDDPFFILTDHSETHQRVVREDRDFHIGIRMQGLSGFQDKACELKINAKPLENRSKTAFSLKEICTPEGDVIRIPIQAGTLEKGIYRLDLFFSVCDAPQIPAHSYKRLLLVQ